MLAVPSRWREPFGIVALEGIACGCVVVASEGGGLAEAVGPCGLTFANGDTAALAAQLGRVLGDDRLRRKLADQAPGQLAPHRPAVVAARYRELLAPGSSLRSVRS